MDDILVYLETYHGHAQHIEWTLGALKDARFKIALEKSEFFLSEISFLGYVVTRGGLRPDSRKVAAVKEALVPTSLTQVRAFLGLASYYQRREPGPARPHTNSDAVPSWSACLEESGNGRNPPSQRGYPDPREIVDLAFFQYRTVSEDEELAIEEEAEEEEEGTEEEEEEEETLEEGSYNEHSEGEQSEEEKEEEDEEEEDEEEEELELEESEWEISAEEGEQTDAQAKDPQATRKGEEIAVGKRQLEFASGANLPIAEDPAKNSELPKPEDGDPDAETSSAPARRRRSRSPSPSTFDRPPVRARTDGGHRASSPVLIPSSP
ncbi:hypothetical protein CBR_g51924 [Chara braunii]|uniref:Reverse transcriptase domain-containing protein n=1 Tax=Chara braunii TaxID=69332 RepID=A0A388M9H8_CHABU|nr:hypothetical protein CBR_g51924 [Chara braunii]|eukprot:GBG91122.1 hypothetical protein CBR_g51924 [Chara braunii]